MVVQAVVAEKAAGKVADLTETMAEGLRAPMLSFRIMATTKRGQTRFPEGIYIAVPAWVIGLVVLPIFVQVIIEIMEGRKTDEEKAKRTQDQMISDSPLWAIGGPVGLAAREAYRYGSGSE